MPKRVMPAPGVWTATTWKPGERSRPAGSTFSPFTNATPSVGARCRTSSHSFVRRIPTLCQALYVASHFRSNAFASARLGPVPRAWKAATIVVTPDSESLSVMFVSVADGASVVYWRYRPPYWVMSPRSITLSPREGQSFSTSLRQDA